MAYEILKGALAASGDKQDIPSLQDGSIANRMSFALGFPAVCSEDKNLGGLPPRRKDLNQALYLLSNNLYEFQNGAFPTFNSSALSYLPGGIGYPEGAILWCETEGRFVRSTKDDNADDFTATPTYIGTSWVFLNDDEVCDDAVGLLLSNSSTNITVGAGFVKSATTGRILKLTSNLSVLWSTIQTDSSITATANTRYNLFLAYNPTTTTYTILCAAYGTFVPSLPTGYVDYALIGYMSTDNNNAVNNVFPQDLDINQWYRSGAVNNDKLTRFCANSGNVNAGGAADLLSVSGSVITFKVGGTYPNLVCTPANQLLSFELSTLNNFNTSTLADGTYVLCVVKNGTVSAYPYISGSLTYISKAEPSTPVSGQLWLDTSKEPLVAYQYNGSSWGLYYGVPLAVVEVASGSVTSSYTLPYNAIKTENTFKNVNVTLATGYLGDIQGDYDLSSYLTDGLEHKCMFTIDMALGANGNALAGISSDCMVGTSIVCGTNNYFRTGGTVVIPVTKKITLIGLESAGFPMTTFKFLGYW